MGDNQRLEKRSAGKAGSGSNEKEELKYRLQQWGQAGSQIMVEVRKAQAKGKDSTKRKARPGD